MSIYGSHFALPVLIFCSFRLGWLIPTKNGNEIGFVLFVAVLVAASWWFTEKYPPR